MFDLPTRRNVISGASALAAVGCAHATPRPSPRPNIVFIMADDLGYADLSCYGRRDYETPGIDRLASQGVRYTQAYSNSPVCSATRTALMTGRYQYRLPVGLEEPLVDGSDLGLPPETPTLPSRLREVGYNTALVGKWHLGALPRYGPLQSGYQHFWGFRGGGVDYFTHSGQVGHDLWDGDVEIFEHGYLTDLLADRAIDQLVSFANADAPFLLSLHFSAPHWPWEGPGDEAESTRLQAGGPSALPHWDGGSAEIYAQMVRRLDEQVGRVLHAIDRLGIAHNTIIVFTSDNGGERFSDTWPFSGRKTELLEGGIRVPCIVRWPARFAPATNNNDVVATMDWSPTLLAAAGVEIDASVTDGLDVFASRDTGALSERTLFWRYKFETQEACRRGRWKYLRIGDNSFLFDLSRDPQERANLKTLRPDIYDSLLSDYRTWDQTMLPLSPLSVSHGFPAAVMPDRYGVTPRSN